jgi:hypothetical protein
MHNESRNTTANCNPLVGVINNVTTLVLGNQQGHRPTLRVGTRIGHFPRQGSFRPKAWRWETIIALLGGKALRPRAVRLDNKLCKRPNARRHYRVGLGAVIPVSNRAIAMAKKEITVFFYANDISLFATPPWRVEGPPILLA